MENIDDKQERRPDLRCLVIDEKTHKKGKLMCHFFNRSFSSLVRELLNECFKKHKHKIESSSIE